MQKDSHNMKIDTLIVLYLYKNRKISIQQIGSFSFDTNIPDPIPEQMKVLPDNSIHFTHDEKTPADEGFIQFIMEQTKKIRPLATSDLESFSALNRQFLNIGKPLVISNLGTLIKTQNNEIAFTQGQSMPPKPEAPKQMPGTKEQAAEPVEFSEKNKPRKKSKWLLPLLLLLLVSVTLGLLFFKINIWDLFKKETPPSEQAATPAQDTADTAKTLTVEPSDSCTFNVVLSSGMDSLTASKSLIRFQKNTDSTAMIIPADSASTFQVIYTLHTLKTDSARLADSIYNKAMAQ